MRWLIVLAMFWSGTSYAGDADQCVRFSATYGENCGNSNSVQIKVQNICAENVKHKVCIPSSVGVECFQGSLKSLEVQSHGYYVCDKGENYIEYKVFYAGCFDATYRDGSCKLPKKVDLE